MTFLSFQKNLKYIDNKYKININYKFPFIDK